MARLIVNGEAIDPARIREETAAVAQLLAEQLPDEDPIVQRMRAREWAEENLIEEVLMRQAKAAGIEPPEVEAPRKSDLMAIYRKNQENFRTPEVVHAAHIVCNVDEKNDEAKARAAIEKAQAALAGGRAFGEVADEFSDCPGRGGDLGFFPKGQMVESFDAVIFGMTVGQVSGIFRTEFGFHIAKLLARRPAGTQPFEQVSGSVAEQLMAEKRQTALHQFLDGLRAKAEVKRVKE